MPLSPLAVKRLQKDLQHYYKDPIKGTWIICDENDIGKADVLIQGPEGTPYEGGFYWFRFQFPDTFPFKPPSVKFMTTGNGVVRFNPNLYTNGKVCLSILGTWSGPSWTSIMTIGTVILSLQTVLNDNPIQNEPGFERTAVTSKNALAYNKYVAYCSIKYAVIPYIQGTYTSYIPKKFRKVVQEDVGSNEERYRDLIKDYRQKYINVVETKYAFSSQTCKVAVNWNELLSIFSARDFRNKLIVTL